jgi:hypothetical protein
MSQHLLVIGLLFELVTSSFEKIIEQLSTDRSASTSGSEEQI